MGNENAVIFEEPIENKIAGFVAGDLYRNLILTVIAIALVAIAFFQTVQMGPEMASHLNGILTALATSEENGTARAAETPISFGEKEVPTVETYTWNGTEVVSEPLPEQVVAEALDTEKYPDERWEETIWDAQFGKTQNYISFWAPQTNVREGWFVNKDLNVFGAQIYVEPTDHITSWGEPHIEWRISSKDSQDTLDIKRSPIPEYYQVSWEKNGELFRIQVPRDNPIAVRDCSGVTYLKVNLDEDHVLNGMVSFLKERGYPYASVEITLCGEIVYKVTDTSMVLQYGLENWGRYLHRQIRGLRCLPEDVNENCWSINTKQ